MSRSLASIAVACVMAASAQIASAQVQFAQLGAVNAVRPYGVSADGTTVVGELGVYPFHWTAASGFRTLPLQGTAEAISADGSTVAGRSGETAFAWRPGDNQLFTAGGWALGVSGDGRAVVGRRTNHASLYWNPGAPPTSIVPTPPGSLGVHLWAASGDGSVVVGRTVDGPATDRALRWSASTGTQFADWGSLQVTTSVAVGVSADGAVSAGQVHLAGVGTRGFIWNAQGVQVLAQPPGATHAFINDLSGDGTVVAGTVLFGSEPAACIWRNGEPYLVSDLLGGLAPPGFRLAQATACSFDGSVVVGIADSISGFDHIGWIATIPAPATANVLIAAWLLTRRRRPAST